mmetsp:Transcript_46817/g.100111  ORF Transcript_46817/g.100111 Transcript_46817/m.100111 type:complete len:628 (-) Transcript_46817:54-1937(-)
MAQNTWNLGNVAWGGTKSHSRRDVHMTIFNTDKHFDIPVETTTKVIEIKYFLAQKLGIDISDLTFLVKSCSTWKKLADWEEMRPKVIVKGIRQWEREKQQYPHPIALIGAGHNGLRQALSFLKEGIKDFIAYDRHDILGGTAWVTNANPTSKLQTEKGVYHLQYDADYQIPKDMSTWPSRRELLDHFKTTCDEFGITAHYQMNTDVTECKVVINEKEGSPYNPKKQQYDTAMKVAGSEDEVEVSFSAVAMYPGGLCEPKRFEYKGEDVFDGQIGYGMFSEFNYSLVTGQSPTVLGFGAFAVENVRTCLEHGAAKAFLICRRKNIAMPRVISWFINQSLFPPPGAMCLDGMKYMYDLIPDDPWEYYGVMANKDKTTATIRQKSRFGIGDLYFLACAYGKCEVFVDAVKRLKPYQILLESGEKLNTEHIIKVLGFSGDETVDQVMSIKEMHGWFVNGDWRRFVNAEFPGVDAGKFGGTSLSPGAIANAETFSWCINYPKDFAPVFDSQMLPRQKADKDKGRPAYVWGPREGASVGMVLGGGVIPALAEMGAAYGPLNRAKQLEAHPLEEFVDECAAEWAKYQQMFKDQGSDVSFVPYPYTKEYVRALCERNDREGQEDQDRQMARMMGS